MASEHYYSVTAIFFLLLAATNYANAVAPTVFDIRNYGAKLALVDAWLAACNSSTPAKVYIAPGTWNLHGADLKGHCKSPIEIELKGTLKAGSSLTNLPSHAWIHIDYVDNFKLYGGGAFDGEGHEAWKKNDCGTNKKISQSLSMNFIDNGHIHEITLKDSKNFHSNCINCNNITFERFTVSAAGTSINTDGLHLGRSHNVTIKDSTFETGDDCISIGDDSIDIRIQNVKCGPGHGISVGSLGRNKDEKDVTGIYVKNVSFIGTDNGVRVKTWPSAPATLTVSKLHFEDITVKDVMYPIVIDQEYCPWNLCNKASPSLIQIRDVKLRNIKGTASTPTAVTFLCSGAKPCQNVEVGDIDISYSGKDGKNITTDCRNVKPSIVGKVNPPLCQDTKKAA